MPIPITPTPTTPIEAQPNILSLELLPVEALLGCQDLLAGASDRARLARYTPEQRAEQGVTSTRYQIKLSFEALRLLASAPEIVPFLDRAQPERWEKVVACRLYGAQCRRALSPVLSTVSGAELLLRGQMTVDSDSIEDHFTAIYRDPQTSDEVRRRLTAKFDDPLRVRQLFEETAAERTTRRSQRRTLGQALKARAEEIRAEERDRAEGEQALRKLAEEGRTR